MKVVKFDDLDPLMKTILLCLTELNKVSIALDKVLFYKPNSTVFLISLHINFNRNASVRLF